jgi:CBS-domain-containing membrane protein
VTGEWGGGEREERDVVRAVTLFAEDTVMSALRVMQQHRVATLAVVDAREGRWLGDVSEEELRRLWEVAPLACMSEVLTVRAALEEAQAGSTWRPRVVLESPLQQVLQVAQRWKH